MKQLTVDDEIKARLKDAILEDIGDGDLTTLATVHAGIRARGRVFAKASGVFCGYPVFEAIFALLDENLECRAFVEEGAEVKPGALLAEVVGEARQILHGERLTLNLMGRMSGVATMTRKYLERMNRPEVTLLDTRKTLPLWRKLDKYAVRAGGGHNHRVGLYDMILIKENHVALAGGICKAIEAAKAARPPEVMIEVETRSLEEVREALAAEPDFILLDNFSPADLRTAVQLTQGKIKLEASGGVTLDNIREIADTGVDRISVGALTHSVVALDLSMLVDAE